MNTKKMARTLMTLSAASLALLPAVAGAQSAAPMPTPPALTAPPSAAQPITVSYYAGNPAQGGKLLSKVTLTRPERGPAGMRPGGQPMNGQPSMAGEPRGPQGMQGQPQAGQPPRGPQGQGAQGQGPQRQGARHHGRGHHNLLLSHAPKGATFAIIKDEHGSHILDLTKPMPRPQGHEAQPGQPVPPQK